MAMRRTLFLFARADIPTVQAAVSTPVAAMLRRQLVGRLERNATEPPIDGDIGDWLTDLEDRVERGLRARKEATGAQLGADVPGLRTRIPPGAPSDRPQNVTSALLTLMSAEGRIVRSVPAGLDQPSSPLGTRRVLVAYGTSATGKGRVAATSGMAMASPWLLTTEFPLAGAT
jgi:hypothetical protein